MVQHAISVAVVTVTLCLGSVSLAQQYQPWTPPGTGVEDLTAGSTGSAERSVEAVLDALSELIAAGRRDRAASPDFLADLDALVAQYNNPWPLIIATDGFADGNYTRDPAWTVVRGSWLVDGSNGLRPHSTSPRSTSATAGRQVSTEELAVRLLGTLLTGSTASGGSRTTDQEEPAAPAFEPSTIALERRIPNAFALGLELGDPDGQGDFEFRAYQRGPDGIGYRLRVDFDNVPALALYRVGSRGTTLIAASADSVTPSVGRAFQLIWLRRLGGEMQVLLGDQAILEVTDTGFRDPWEGLAIHSDAGSPILRRIEIAGTSG